MWTETLFLCLKPLGETVYMVLLSSSFAHVFGIPLGFLLFAWQRPELRSAPRCYTILSGALNALRSVPFIILLIALIPLARFLVGSSIGVNAAVVSLTVAAIPFVARVSENALQALPQGLLTVGQAMGATPWQIVRYFLWPEAKAGLLTGGILTAVNLVSYSAMAGAIGGGGLGDLAIRYGYQRFDIPVMLCTIAILVMLVQAIQCAGDFLLRRLPGGKRSRRSEHRDTLSLPSGTP